MDRPHRALHGRSTEVAREWPVQERPIDLAFVDGGHDLRTARHDILAACALGADRVGLLADDYIERPGYGVVAAFRELFGDQPPVTVIGTSWGDVRGGTGAGMAWLDLDGPSKERDRLRALWERSQRRGLAAILGR